MSKTPWTAVTFTPLTLNLTNKAFFLFALYQFQQGCGLTAVSLLLYKHKRRLSFLAVSVIFNFICNFVRK